jgi:autonomous glycyl radical cofactor GrcA
MEEYIQTLHPQANKTNKKILIAKYNFIKEHLLLILVKGEFTHTELMEELYARVKDNFEGGVQWYGETVKLDLEARQIIERTKSKPEKYRLITQNS